jgi:hypothetical protein
MLRSRVSALMRIAPGTRQSLYAGIASFCTTACLPGERDTWSL